MEFLHTFFIVSLLRCAIFSSKDLNQINFINTVIDYSLSHECFPSDSKLFGHLSIKVRLQSTLKNTTKGILYQFSKIY